MDVDPFSLAVLLLLLASLGAARAARRRAARRLAEERARARARRRSVPEVSANLRGLPTGSTDLWAEERRSKSPPVRPS
jgi:phage protein D